MLDFGTPFEIPAGADATLLYLAGNRIRTDRDAAALPAPEPMDVLRVNARITADMGAASVVLKLQRKPVAGSWVDAGVTLTFTGTTRELSADPVGLSFARGDLWTWEVSRVGAIPEAFDAMGTMGADLSP